MEVRKRINVPNDEEDQEKNLLDIVKQIDAFDKMPTECKKYTSSGGGGNLQIFQFTSAVSILSFVVIALLCLSEINRYMNPQIAFSYSIDHELNETLPINVDITVPMKCDGT